MDWATLVPKTENKLRSNIFFCGNFVDIWSLSFTTLLWKRKKCGLGLDIRAARHFKRGIWGGVKKKEYWNCETVNSRLIKIQKASVLKLESSMAGGWVHTPLGTWDRLLDTPGKSDVRSYIQLRERQWTNKKYIWLKIVEWITVWGISLSI